MLSTVGPGCISLFLCVTQFAGTSSPAFASHQGTSLVGLLGCGQIFSRCSEFSLFTEQRTTSEVFSKDESLVLEAFQNSETETEGKDFCGGLLGSQANYPGGLIIPKVFPAHSSVREQVGP